MERSLKSFLSMKLLFGFTLLIVSLGAHAGVDLKSTQRIEVPTDTVTPKITSEDVAKVVPLDLQQGESESRVFSRIADRGVSLWINSSILNDTSVGRLAKSTQEKLKTDIILPAKEPEGISHKFTLKVEAFQALARMHYSGWLKADFNYDLKSSTADFLVHEKIFVNKDLIFSHRTSREQALSSVALAWSW